LIERGAVDYVQPDACHVGGLIEVKKIAALAQMHYLGLAPHNPIGPVGNALTLQLAACIPNFVVLETMMTDVPWCEEVFQEDIELVDGEMLIPRGPGLGVEFNEAAATKYPYKFHPLRHYSGDLTDIRPPEERRWYNVKSTS
jgi:galactonate dehydratase